MDDISKAVSMDAKTAGNFIYLIGITRNELGGSQYYKMKGFTGNSVPQVDPVYGKKLMNALTGAIKKGLIHSCHDCSEGGIAVALAEMAFAGGLGMSAHLGAFTPPKQQKALPDGILLFSESNTRFIVEVKDELKFVKAMSGLPVWKLGYLRPDKTFRIFGADEKLMIDTDIDALKEAWQKPFSKL
jgi:phosphoribosylformylglycinamidine synthase